MPTAVEKVGETTATENQSYSKSEGLKIALQVLGHDSARILLPAITIAIGVACGAGVLIWCILELQKLPTISLPRGVPMIEQLEQKPAPIVTVQKSAPVKRTVKRTKKVRTAKAAKPRTSQYAYDYWAPDHPTGGRVVRYDYYTTDYSWNSK